MRKISLLGVTTLTAIERCVEATINSWLVDWSLEPQTVTAIAAKMFDVASLQANDNLTMYSHPRGATLLMQADKHLCRDLLFAGRPAPHDELAAHLLQQSASELAVRLFTACGLPQESPVERQQQAIDSKLWQAGVMCSVSMPDATFTLFMDAACIAPHAKPKPTAVDKSLVSRAEALLGASCRATVTLSLGEIPLQQLQSLSAGDILFSDTPLSSPFYVAVGKTLRLNAHLGCKGQRKAVYLSTL